MSIEQRLADAVKTKTEAAQIPSLDVAALREQARHHAHPGAAAMAVAAAVLVIVGIIGGATLLRAKSPTESPSGPAHHGPQVGMRAFLDPNAGVLHLDDRTLPLAGVPGLVESGLAIPGGVVYQTPDQEVRIIDPSGQETVLAAALGPPPEGFTPSVAFDAGSDVVVALRLAADSPAGGRPLISAYNAATGERLASTPMVRMYRATQMTLAGATNGVAALNLPGEDQTGPGGPHVLNWTWTERHDGSEWRRGHAFDMANRVVLVDWRVDYTQGPRFEYTGWRFVDSGPGERLDPTGAWRVDTTWQPWPSGGPAQKSTFGEDDAPLPELPPGSLVSLAYDTDGSVLAAVASGEGPETVVRMFDCDLAANACEPIGRVEGAVKDSLFLDGAKP